MCAPVRNITLLLLALIVCRSPVAAAGESNRLMARAAHEFLASLTSEQRAECVFPFSQEEWEKWHFIPMRSRIGLRYDRMTSDQVHLADVLVASGLSRSGYHKTKTIMSLEALLRELDRARGVGEDLLQMRNPEHYYFAVYGDPDTGGLWGWRVEGHHVSFHFSIDGEEIRATTPMFMGANPHRVLEGPRKGLVVLGAEEELARSLLESLDEQQRAVAILASEAPADIFTSNAREVEFSTVPSKGLVRRDMTDRQKELLQALIDEYISNLPEDLAQVRAGRVRESGDDIYFAWMGSLLRGPGHGHYYRVQGKTFLIEYDNTQDNANHVHTVWRDYENDFGRDWIAEHYRLAH